MIFNLQEHENRNLLDFYDMVRNGKWILDEFEKITKGIAQDLNGDGKIGFGDFSL